MPGVLFVGFVDRFWEGIKVGEFEGASEDMGRTERMDEGDSRSGVVLGRNYLLF